MLPNRFTEPDIPRQASDVKWMKGGQNGGRKGRKIESERGLRNGGWWRHREETMNTKGKSNQKGNQLFIKQHSLSLLQSSPFIG